MKLTDKRIRLYKPTHQVVSGLSSRRLQGDPVSPPCAGANPSLCQVIRTRWYYLFQVPKREICPQNRFTADSAAKNAVGGVGAPIGVAGGPYDRSTVEMTGSEHPLTHPAVSVALLTFRRVHQGFGDTMWRSDNR